MLKITFQVETESNKGVVTLQTFFLYGAVTIEFFNDPEVEQLFTPIVAAVVHTYKKVLYHIQGAPSITGCLMAK